MNQWNVVKFEKSSETNHHVSGTELLNDGLTYVERFLVVSGSVTLLPISVDELRDEDLRLH